MRRTTLGLIALFSSALLAFGSAPAGARATVDARDTTGLAAVRGEAPLPPHDVRRLKAFEIRDTGRFRVTGKAVTYRGKDVILKKASRKAGPYRYAGKDRTDRNGRFAINFSGRIGTHFRVVLKRTPRNRATTYYIGRIVRD